MSRFDVAIVGGGVIGCAVARELSRYELDVGVFEAGSDVASGSSRANSGVLHSGINSPPGSMKAKLCVEGNQLFRALARELGVEARWIGKLVVASEGQEGELQRLMDVGAENGVPGLELWDGESVSEREPRVRCHGALWVPTAGIVSPCKFTIALAECAHKNGARFHMDTRVTGLERAGDGFTVETDRGAHQASVVINSAGIACREIASMLEEPDFDVHPCRGQYLVLDKAHSRLISSMVYPVPPRGEGVLGVHITPTVEGNILLGPSAEYIEDGTDIETTRDVMERLLIESRALLPDIPVGSAIRAFSGMRCKLASQGDGGWADFRIEESGRTPGLVNLLGIESPGLTASPAIAREVARLVGGIIELREKGSFEPSLGPRRRFSSMSDEERSSAIAMDASWGRVVCRCEHVAEAEVREALSNPLGARTLSAAKARCRAGSGRCQGGFCTQHVVRLMQEEFDVADRGVTLRSKGSALFTGRTRGEPDD